MDMQDRTRLTADLKPFHTLVLLNEILAYFKQTGCKVFVDGTTGEGGHTLGFLKNTDAHVVCFDADSEIQQRAKERLQDYAERVTFVHSNFRYILKELAKASYTHVDAILLDLGISMAHLKDINRGITFATDQPLDMRLDTTEGLPLSAMLPQMTESEIADVIFKYGEERASRRIARAIVYYMDKKPITTTGELAGLIEKSIGRKGKIHPATRTFQAFRIFINQELTSLELAIPQCLDCLAPGGILAVISYHSLEDRIVKHMFKDAKGDEFEVLTKKPIIPTEQETESNRAARSAKLRIIRRVCG